MASYDDTATVSGSVVSIENGADDVPTKSLVVTIPPTLSGVSSVTETQTGKNLFDKTAITENSIIGHGTGVISTNNAYFVSDYIPVKFGVTYYFTGFNYWYQSYYDENKNLSETMPPNTAKATIPVGVSYLRVSGQNTNIDTAQLEIGESASTYEAFNGTTYTASLGRTIYGGTADIVNSTGKDTTLRYELDENDSWSAYSGASHSFWHNVATGEDRPIKQTEASESICNYATYSSASPSSAPDFSFLIQGGQRIVVTADSTIDTVDKFKTWLSSHNLVFVCPSSTPTDYTFDGQEVPTRLGYNAFWSEQGDTELTYYKSGYGFTSVTVNKTGKNLIYPKYSGRSSSGITYVVNSDHSVTCSGISTNTSWAAANLTTKPEFMQLIPKGTYFLTGGISSDIQIYLSGVYVDDGTAITQRADTGSGATYTFEKSVLVYPQIRIASGVDLTTPVTIRFQLELGPQASSYEPYEAVTKTAKLHKVIYGGTADVIRGTCEPKNMLPMTNYDGGVYNPDVGRQLNLTVSQTQFEKTGGVYSVSTTSTWKTFTVLFPIISGATYYEKWTLSVESGQQGSTRAYLDEDFKVLAKYNNNSSTPITTNGVMSPPTGAKYLAITWTNRGTAVQTLNITEPQIEKGTSASDYAPYFEPFTFPPISMETDEGENTLFANDGDSAITYRKAVD